MSEFKTRYEAMPEVPTVEDFRQLFTKMSFVHEVHCCFHPEPKPYTFKRQLCDIRHTRNLVEADEPGHICDRGVLIMAVIRSVLEGSMVPGASCWYFSTKLYEKRVFLRVTRNAVVFINADFNGWDYHPLTRLIFWLTVLAPNNTVNKIEMPREFQELLLKELHRDRFLKRPCVLVETKTETGENEDKVQCTSLMEMMKYFDDKVCATCQRPTTALFYGGVIVSHYEYDFYLYFCMLAPLINGWKGTDFQGRSWYGDDMVEYQSGDDLTFRQASYHYVVRRIFLQFLHLGYVTFSDDSDDHSSSDSDDDQSSDFDDE